MKKHKMVIHIEIPLNVETEQEANEQMVMIMKANTREFDSIGDMVRVFKGRTLIERKLI
ncbi:hypothetical protein [Veillonella tobetsuensis]|jgi:hypothetical protein|uniref:hypothetical protein n=1 Tax=Veillonella tobetsuensis TaxID=1110546 RepID=UPI000ABE7C04|nr:hypothetical protein [Veillonella tobetsuensis]